MQALPWPVSLPVVAAPMFLISGPQLVLAACRAGIIGAFPTPNARPIEVLEQWMIEITEGLTQTRRDNPQAVIGPWCANVVTHSSNTRLPEDLRLIQKYQPPIVVTALGSPRPALQAVHSYGGIVIADVSNLNLARKAADAGADGLACISSGAGGHTGSISPLAFIPAVRKFFNGLVVVGGAISDGWSAAAAITCGADLVYMGTRFIATTESMASPEYKQMLVASSVNDILVSPALTGTPASWLKPSLLANGLDPDNLPSAPARSYDSNTNLSSKRWLDVWGAGQGVGAIDEVISVASLVDELKRDYAQARNRLATMRY